MFQGIIGNIVVDVVIDPASIPAFPNVPPDYKPFPDVPQGVGNEPFPAWVKQDARKEAFKNTPGFFPGETYEDIIGNIGRTSDAAQAYDVTSSINRAINDWIAKGGIPVVAPAPPPMVLSSPVSADAGLGDTNYLTEGNEMAFDLGGFLGGVAETALDLGTQWAAQQMGLGNPQQAISVTSSLPEIVTQGAQMVYNLVTDPQTGQTVAVPCKHKTRRRRRRLLTASDFEDLQLLKTLVKGEAFNAAVIKAVGR